METDTALVRADCAVHLHTISSVYLNLAFVIQPWDSEDDDSFRFYDSFENLLVDKVRVLHHVRGYTFKHFLHCLVKLLLTGILRCQIGHEAVDILFSHLIHNVSIC